MAEKRKCTLAAEGECGDCYHQHIHGGTESDSPGNCMVGQCKRTRKLGRPCECVPVKEHN